MIITQTFDIKERGQGRERNDYRLDISKEMRVRYKKNKGREGGEG
jgi:hypothetical protein